ncbi:FAD-dependent urate hydroxylase [Echria macrotheca]|uniref:FAD-dependent urate hydroxylase n=1 Tax=Echria macrotheca TaxID=438768 RepID=A0AAJ0B6Z2_9PEZI|nr:FAD-dependent urate hydroxylase [Echria macrotheca]
MSGQKPHVLIIGAGIGGLTLAQSLRKRGVTFEIFERDASRTFRGQGYAIGLYDLGNLFGDALPDDVPPIRDSCHLLPLPLPSQLVFHLPDRMLTVEDSPETPCIRANRGRLREILSTGLDIHWDKEAVRIDEVDDMVTVFFRDGTSASGELVVGADGTHSAVRPHVLKQPNSEMLYKYPNPPVGGEVKLRGAEMEGQLQLGYSSYIAFGPGFTFFNGINQVNVEDDGSVSADYYWVISNNETSLEGTSNEELLDYALNKVQPLEPKFRCMVERTKPEGIRQSFGWWDALIPASRLPPVNRTLLIGDACHPMTPNLGEGAIFAIREGVRLGDILGQTDLSDMVSLRAKLDEFQRDIADKGHESVLAARMTMNNTRKGTAPMAWGHRMSPLAELKPLPIKLSEWRAERKHS